MSESTDVEERLLQTLRSVAATVPDVPPRTWTDFLTLDEARAAHREAAVSSAHGRSSRARHLVLALTVALGVGVVGTAAAAATGAISGNGSPSSPPLFTRQVHPPPQQDTTGTPLPQSQVLQRITSQFRYVTRAAIKTMSYGTISAALANAGFKPASNVDKKWTPVPASDPVDVVAIAGKIVPRGATGTYAWIVEVVNPVTGAEILLSASSDGSWPTFFDALPDHR